MFDLQEQHEYYRGPRVWSCLGGNRSITSRKAPNQSLKQALGHIGADYHKSNSTGSTALEILASGAEVSADGLHRIHKLKRALGFVEAEFTESAKKIGA